MNTGPEQLKHNKKKALTTGFFLSSFYFCFLLSLAAAPGFAQDDNQLLKMTYEAGDYGVVIKLAGEVIGRQPGNALAHYYLASALVKTGHLDTARQEYTKCLTFGRGTTLAKSAAAALQSLAGDGEPAPSAAEQRISQKARLERQNILAQQEIKKQEARKRFDEKVNHYQSSNLPADQLKTLSQQAYEQLTLEEEQITEQYQKRADALLRHNTDHSYSAASSEHVQNFVIPGDPSQAATIPGENTLSAKALKLGEGYAKKKQK